MKELLKRIKELANSFINPIPPEKSLDELAVAAGIGEADLALLKNSSEGVTWNFADDIGEAKKGRSTRVAPKENQVQPEQRTVVTERNKGTERD